MSSSSVSQNAAPPSEAEEWELRCDLAATFRIFARNSWNEQIGNHHSMMIPGTDGQFLINPRGMLYREIRASDLIVCDLAGNKVRGKGEVRRIAFNIHAEIHKLHPQAACVLHVHPPYLTAFSLIKGGRFVLAHQNNLFLNGRIAYDDGHHGIHFGAAEGSVSLKRSETRAFSSWPGTASRLSAHGSATLSTNSTWPSGPACIRCSPCRRGSLSCSRPMTCSWIGLAHLAITSTSDFLDAWRRVLDREEPDYAS